MIIKFLKNTCYYSIFLILCLTIVQLLISYRIKGKLVSGNDNWDTTANINADLVLLGSSRCWVHFDPTFFEEEFNLKTVNLGMSGHSKLSAIQLRLENYLAKNKAPKFVIVSFDPFTKPQNNLPNKSLIDKNKYSRFAFMPTKENEALVNYFGFNSEEKYVPLYAIFKYKLLGDCITLNKSNLYPKGFEMNDEVWDTTKSPVNDEMKKYFFKENEIQILKKQLNDFNLFCKKKNIKLICIQTPVYKVLYNEKNFEQSISICRNNNIKIIDANYEKIRNNSDYFYNTNHLNKNGVIEMNKLLKNEKELINFLK